MREQGLVRAGTAVRVEGVERAVGVERVEWGARRREWAGLRVMVRRVPADHKGLVERRSTRRERRGRLLALVGRTGREGRRMRTMRRVAAAQTDNPRPAIRVGARAGSRCRLRRAHYG